MKDFLKKLPGILHEYLKPFLISLCCIVLAVCAVCGLYIRFTKPKNPDLYPEKIKYSLFGTVSKISSEVLLNGSVLCVDLSGIAGEAGFGISGNASELRISSADGLELAVFTDGSDFVTVNGVRLHMECAARFDGTKIYVPVSFVNSCTRGVSITLSEDRSKLNIDKTDEDFTFTFRSSDELKKISDENVPAQYLIEDSELDYDFKTDITAYKAYLNPSERSSLLLYFGSANKAESTFVPADMIDSSNTKEGTTIKLNINAAKALEAMIAEMKADGITGMYISRGYQSYDAQKYNFDNFVYSERYHYKNNFEKDGTYFSAVCFEILGSDYLYSTYINKEKFALSQSDAETVVVSYCAAPGTGDHITGLGMDLHNKTGAKLEFADTDAYTWLCENAYKFGFIERFPSDREKMTGFHYEPYHWRFVGQYHAAVMHREGYCLEEYLSSLGLVG